MKHLKKKMKENKKTRIVVRVCVCVKLLPNLFAVLFLFIRVLGTLPHFTLNVDNNFKWSCQSILTNYK